jgi:hypothetical protein
MFVPLDEKLRTLRLQALANRRSLEMNASFHKKRAIARRKREKVDQAKEQCDKSREALQRSYDLLERTQALVRVE